MATKSPSVSTATFPPAAYALDGRQVAPSAAWQLLAPTLRVPTLAEIRTACAPLLAAHPFAATRVELDAELAELHHLAGLRADKTAIGGTFEGRTRRPLSRLLTARAAPNGGFGDQHTVGGPAIQTGADLARWFENDTPLLGGWMALNAILKCSPVPPTRQAEIWTVLNCAISSALLATWHYKWNELGTRMKPRPTEVDPTLTVLYATAPNGTPVPGNQPGVPRHPSYPSGHSTVGGATAAALKFFFPSYTTDLDELADNAGLARMWAGIHYRADHEVGVAIGEAVAGLVLQNSGSTPG